MSHNDRRRKKSSEESDGGVEISVCPADECNSYEIYRRSPRGNHVGGRWYCLNCNEAFDEPAYREPERERSIGNRGVGLKLSQMDPDELGVADD